MGKLLNKKFILVFLSILLVVGGLVLIYRLKGGNIDNSSNNTIKYQKENKIFSDFFKDNMEDSDNDGLKNWEEILWKTDKNNSDTDGDGMSDDEEIKNNRNPVIAGPNDLFKINSTNNTTSTTVYGDSVSPLMNFFGEYIRLKEEQSGDNLSDSAKQELLKSFQVNFSQEILDEYELSDIKITEINTKERLRQYGNILGEIIDRYKFEENELIIFGRAVKENKTEELIKFEAIANIYSDVSDNFIKIEAPSKMKDEHLALVNGLNNINKAIREMQKFFQDPIASFVGFNNYSQESLRVYNTLKNLQSKLTEMGISFNSNEPGRFLLSIK